MGAWAGREEARGAGDAHAELGLSQAARGSMQEAPGGGERAPGRRPFAGREGRPERTRERKKGQEVPYRHRATLPPHPLRSRRSAPTLGARPRRPTWPPRAQLIKAAINSPLQPFPSLAARGLERGANPPASERRRRETQIQGRWPRRQRRQRTRLRRRSARARARAAAPKQRGVSRWLRFRGGGHLSLVAPAHRSWPRLHGISLAF